MTEPARDDTHLLTPLCFAAAILIAIVPWLHPVGTCTDWLMKWGEAMTIMPKWVAIHKLGMIGFALAAGVGLFFPILGLRSFASIAAGASMSAGFALSSMVCILHATSVSVIGKAYNASTNPIEQKMLRTVAEAFVSYDVATTSVASLLASIGCTLLVVALLQRQAISKLAAAFMIPLGLVWAAQYYRVFNKMGFSISEHLHWASLGLWLAGIGTIMFVRRWRDDHPVAEEPEASLRATATADAKGA